MASIIPFVLHDQQGECTIVTDRTKFIFDDGKVLIENYVYESDDDAKSNISYDLHVGERYWSIKSEVEGEVFADKVTLKPGDAIIIVTKERVFFPRNRMGIIFPKVTYLESGLANICTKIDPGFHDNLRITVHNLGKKAIDIEKGQEFCSMCVLSIDEQYSIEHYGKSLHEPKQSMKKERFFKRITNFIGKHFAVIIAVASLIATTLIAIFK